MAAESEYPWLDMKDLPVEEQQEQLEERREELLAEAGDGGGMTDSLQQEWCQLLLERDRVLKLKVAQDNQRLLHGHMITLLQLLITIGQFDHSSTPSSLKSSLYSLYTEISTHIQKQDKDLSADRSRPPAKDDPTKVTTKTPPIPPTPPPILNLPAVTPSNHTEPNEKRLRLDDSSVEEALLGPMRRKSKTTSPLVTPSKSMSSRLRSKVRGKKTPGIRYTPGGKYTPRQLSSKTEEGLDSEDLRRCLLTGRDNLKSTPGVKRSPGGTPQRSKEPIFSSENPSDIVSIALQKKFYNVRRLYGSPMKDAEDEADSREASFNLSID